GGGRPRGATFSVWPLSSVATALILGIFKEFGALAVHSRQAAAQADWEPAVLREWGVRVYLGRQPAYIYNQALHYFLENHNDRNQFDALAVVFARAFANARPVNEHGLIYAIFFQWADELGQGKHVSQLRAGLKELQNLFLSICKQLDDDDFEAVRRQMMASQSDKGLPKHVREFAGKIARDLNSPSMRYVRRSKARFVKKRG
ncbi:MAG: hypothetical protein ACPGWR_28880, partial [Ardenticatenaceae bacterium]